MQRQSLTILSVSWSQLRQGAVPPAPSSANYYQTRLSMPDNSEKSWTMSDFCKFLLSTISLHGKYVTVKVREECMSSGQLNRSWTCSYKFSCNQIPSLVLFMVNTVYISMWGLPLLLAESAIPVLNSNCRHICQGITGHLYITLKAFNWQNMEWLLLWRSDRKCNVFDTVVNS